MKDQKQLLILLVAFLGLRLLLFNVNIAEWGDSYDFLRIAESLTHGQYPLDAKRLPVFPLLIAIGMPFLDAVVWAKIIVLLASAGCLFLTYKLTRSLFPQLPESWLLIAVCCLLISPIFLYWSIRIVAEPVFAFFVLLAFHLFYSDKKLLGDWGFWGILGLVCGLAAMTRYEGFFLFASIFAGLLLAKKFKPLILYSLFFILIVSPWFVRNYFTFGKIFYSPYTSDPAGFVTGSYYRWQWLFYTLFMFGFPFGFYALLCGLWEKRRDWLKHLPLFLFVSLSLLLFLVWYPRARFYLYLIPLLLPFVICGLKAERGWGIWGSLGSLFLLLLYLFGVLKFRFFFLGPGKLTKAVVLGSGLGAVVLMRRYFIPLLTSLVLISEVAVSFGVISNQRLIYSSVYQAVHDPSIAGRKVAYFDETGVTAWYLRKNGIYYNEELTPKDQLEWLGENKACYVLWTNEHNEGPELTVVIDPNFSDQFQLLREYTYNIGEVIRGSRIYQLKECQN